MQTQKPVFHFATNVSLESGGQRTAVVNLHNYLDNQPGWSSIIYTNSKEISDNFLEFPSTRFRFWNYAPELTSQLSSTIEDARVVHLHGVFMHTQYAPSKLAKKHDIPSLITPHGMLEPWYLNDKRLKKAIYVNVVLKNLFRRVDAVHAITPSEKNNLFKLFAPKKIFEIPNFIHLSTIPSGLEYRPDEKYILFLSRIHPGKGLDILFQAFSRLNDKNIKLKVAGSKNFYTPVIQSLAKKLGVSERVEFLGGIYGQEKYNLYANAQAFVLPSYSEAIGMVNLEAAACATPIITTFSTGLSPEVGTEGGIIIHPDVDELTQALTEAAAWGDHERRERGRAIKEFISQKYSWEAQGYLWKQLYLEIMK